MMQQRFAHRLHLRILSWQRFIRGSKAQRRQLKQITQTYQTACKKESMIHWRCIALYAKRMRQVARRFLLVPQWRRWRQVFAQQHEESRLYAHILPTWQLKRKKRIWTMWRIYVVRQVRWALQFKLVRKMVVTRQRRQALTAWVNVMDNQKLVEKYVAIRSRQGVHCLRRAWNAWYRLALKFELINYKNMKAVLTNWKYNLENHRRQARAMQIAQQFHWNRLGFWAMKKWKLRMQWMHYRRNQEMLALRRFHRKCYLSFFRKWKRQMYISYYHHQPHRRGPGFPPGRGPTGRRRMGGGEDGEEEEEKVRGARRSLQLLSQASPTRARGAAHRYRDSETRRRYYHHEEAEEEVGGRLEASWLAEGRTEVRERVQDRRQERLRSPLRDTSAEKMRSSALNTSIFGTESQTKAPRTHRPGLSLSHLTSALPSSSAMPTSRFQSSVPPTRLSSPSPSRSVPYPRPGRESTRSLHAPHRARSFSLFYPLSVPAKTYQRLLNYDRDECTWQPYRMFVHWRRLTARRVHLRRALLAKRLFFHWKHYTHVIKFRRQAFWARLSSLRRRSLCLLLWQPLYENYKLGVNRKYLEYCRRKRRLQGCFQVWWRFYANHMAVRNKIHDVIQQIYLRQRLRCWQTWKVKAGPAVRLQRLWLKKKAYGFWRKLFISQLYARFVTAHRVFLTWKWKVQVDKAVYHVWRLRRQKLANILHR